VTGEKEFAENEEEAELPMRQLMKMFGFFLFLKIRNGTMSLGKN
jgi:hypothetical protein